MAEAPDVSVVIPTRNRWPLLSATALPAALGQENVELEVVVVDDGSTDETAARLREVEEREKRLRVVCRTSPGGVAAARNAGIAEARGRWIAFLDDDDVWSPRKLRAQLDRAVAEEADFVYAGAVAIDESGHVLYRYYFPEPEELERQLLIASVIPGGASNVLARGSLVRELGGFDEQLFQIEDWDFWIRLASRARAAALPDVHVGVVVHPANKHSTHDHVDELEYLIEKHATMSPPREITMDRVGYERWVAAEHNRAGKHGRAAALYLRGAVRHRRPGNVLRAMDAVTGKRFSQVVTRRRRATSPIEAPSWLERFSYFAGDRRGG